MSVMVVKVLLKTWSPPTGPTAKYEGGHQLNNEGDQRSYLRNTCLSKTSDVYGYVGICI